jgi:hypothetical protein
MLYRAHQDQELVVSPSHAPSGEMYPPFPIVDPKQSTIEPRAIRYPFAPETEGALGEIARFFATYLVV